MTYASGYRPLRIDLPPEALGTEVVELRPEACAAARVTISDSGVLWTGGTLILTDVEGPIPSQTPEMEIAADGTVPGEWFELGRWYQVMLRRPGAKPMEWSALGFVRFDSGTPRIDTGTLLDAAAVRARRAR